MDELESRKQKIKAYNDIADVYTQNMNALKAETEKTEARIEELYQELDTWEHRAGNIQITAAQMESRVHVRPVQSANIYCTKCGNYVGTDSFCGKCGARVKR